MFTRYGDYFEWVELWNEPNNTLEYDFTRDYSWSKFSTMIRMASYWAQHRGKKTLLGGMSPIDPNWLRMMAENGTLEFIEDRKSTRLNSSHVAISYAVFCLKTQTSR